MIELRTGNLLDADAEALVNTVNCVGVMGRGIALQFKKAWPDNFKAYAAACKRDEVEPGRMFVFETGLLTNPRYIINFPTKRHWRSRSRLSDIDAGLTALVSVIQEHGIQSIALPPLGSGLGGLEWREVKKHIEDALSDIGDVQVLLYEPHGAPAAGTGIKTSKVPAMTPGRAALIGLMERYLGGLLDPFVSLLEVHKLMYFMQEAGEPLRLRFSKGSYGPYAENLRHVLNAIEGHYVTGYGVGGDQPDKPLELVDNATQKANTVLNEQPESSMRFERVSQLVAGFESPFGLELLSTVHWILEHDQAASDDELVERTYAWSERKRRFSPDQIHLAARTLRDKGWTRA